jgi:hypothetical protein
VVFDTSSAPVGLSIAGRHLILFAPSEGSRRVGEVYELSNDTALTLVPAAGRPVWSAAVPRGVIDLQVNPAGDLPDGALALADARVSLNAPLSPGVRQISFAYSLPPSRFPLTVPLEQETALLEILVQEPAARVSGAGLTEVAPVQWQGEMFRRFIAEGVARDSSVRIEFPSAGVSAARRAIVVLLTVMVAVMAGAFYLASRRRDGSRADPLRSRSLAPTEADR